jgi:hypothetical protein
MIKYLALAAVIMLTGFAHADPVACTTASIINVIGTTCTIGDMTFTFGGGLSNFNEPDVTFTPESTSTSAGFTLSGFPLAFSFPGNTSPPEEPSLAVGLSAVPLIGSIVSGTVTLSGVVQTGSTTDSTQDSGASLGGYAGDDVQSIGFGPMSDTSLSGGPLAYYNGSLTLENFESPGPAGGPDETDGTAFFQSATFTFNVPEGSELGMIFIAAGAIFGAMKMKLA